MKFYANQKQEQAFNKVIKAIKDAQKLGLVFYGKCDSLVAYTKQADDYIEEDFEGSLSSGFSQVDYLSETVLADSGADDVGCYRSEEDEEKYSY